MSAHPVPHTLAVPSGTGAPLLDGRPLCLAEGSPLTIEHHAGGISTATVELLIKEIVALPVSRAEAAVADHLAWRTTLTPRRAKEVARDLAEAGMLVSDEDYAGDQRGSF